jgi:hypothetical protein
MKFYSAVVACLFAASVSVEQASAFSPRNYAPNKSGLMVPNSNEGSSTQQSSKSGLWTPNAMKMVAGGAERAYGQEYYEGTCEMWLIVGHVFGVTVIFVDASKL